MQAMQMMHMCLDTRGALNWPKRELAKLVRDKVTGRYLSADAAREWLLDELAKGHEVLPMCDCPNFDFKKGCPGKAVSEGRDG